MIMIPMQPQKWTQTHGHFLVMGGFILVDSQSTSHVLSFEHFQHLVCETSFEFPPITEDEINDKSKGDLLSKLLAISHTTWFIVQVIARRTTGLAITELELISVALASLNAITYAIWWNKPLQVQEPVKIYLPPNSQFSQEFVTRTRDQLGHENNLPPPIEIADVPLSEVFLLIMELFKHIKAASSKIIFRTTRREPLTSTLYNWLICLPVYFLFFITFPIFALFPICLGIWLRIIHLGNILPHLRKPGPAVFKLLSFWNLPPILPATPLIFSSMLNRIRMNDTDLTLLVPWFSFFPRVFITPVHIISLFHILFTLIYVVFASMFDIVTSSTVDPFAIRVPPFYAPITKRDPYSRMIAFAIFGTFFGGIHCVAWNFEFPSPVEKTLWRCTSVIVTAIPLVVASLDFILSWRSRDDSEFTAEMTVLEPESGVTFQGTDDPRRIGPYRGAMATFISFLEISMNLLIIVYTPLRISLIVQALMCLRAQPPSAYIAIQWANYLPHIA